MLWLFSRALWSVAHGAASTGRLAFGSCTAQYAIQTGERIQQPLWPHVVKRQPEAFVWVGDAIYSDEPWFNVSALLRGKKPVSFRDVTQAGVFATKAEQLAALYSVQAHEPGYASLLETNTAIYGVYDDHDFGTNNGDGTYAAKDAGSKAFLDFIGEPAASPRRKAAARGGIYDSHALTLNGVRVLLLLLDVRYARSPYGLGIDDGTADILGAAQWAWLRAQLDPAALARDEVDAIVVASGVQVLPTTRGPAENWERYPARRRELLALLRGSRIAHILVSGDVHFSEFAQVELCSAAPRGAGLSNGERRAMELTTSGMTHSWTRHDTIVGGPFGRIAGYMMARVFDAHSRFWPSPERVAAYGGINWAEIEFNAARAGGAKTATVRVFEMNGRLVMRDTVSLAPLPPCASTETAGNGNAAANGGAAATRFSTTVLRSVALVFYVVAPIAVGLWVCTLTPRLFRRRDASTSCSSRTVDLAALFVALCAWALSFYPQQGASRVVGGSPTPFEGS